MIAVKPKTTRSNLKTKINGDKILQKFDNVRFLELTRTEQFKGTKEENWFNHIYRELANFSSGKLLAKEYLDEALQKFLMLDQYEDLDLRFTRVNPESISAQAE